MAFALPYTIQCGMQGWQPIPIAAGNVSRDGMIDAGVLLVYVLLLCYTRMRLTRLPPPPPLALPQEGQAVVIWKCIRVNHESLKDIRTPGFLQSNSFWQYNSDPHTR